MAKIDDTVKTWFLGDSIGLVTAANKANAALDSNAKAEARTAKAAQVARREWEARAKSLQTALVKPAQELQKTTGILNSGLKLTALAGGIGLAADKFNELRSEALASRKEMEAFGETYRQFSQANKRPSGAEDATGLIGKLTEAHSLETTLKDRRLALHPEPGFDRWRMMNQYNAGFPGHGVEEWKSDISKNKSQIQDNDLTQLNLRKAIDQSFRNEVDLTKEGLQGSNEQLRIKTLELARTREIRALEGTVANNDTNKSAINEKIDLQIAKEREMESLRDKQFMRDSQALGISRRLISDEEKRVQLLQSEADGVSDQLRTRQFTNDEESQALQLRAGQLANDLRLAKGAAAVAESQYRLAQQTVTVQRSNTSAASQLYKTQQNTLASLREQLAVEKDLNGTRARGLQITIDQGENTLRLDRQSAGYGKTPGQIQQKINRDRKEEASRDIFDKRTARDDGLINVKRGMDGSIISGTDMVTGEVRAPRPGAGRGKQGLEFGSLSDGAVGTTGAASLTRDADLGGGLSSGGTPRMFERTGAAQKLNHPTGAAAALLKSSGDPAHDPAARLRNATIFPNLTGQRNDARDSHNVSTSAAALILKASLDQHVQMNNKLDKMLQGIGTIASWGLTV